MVQLHWQEIKIPKQFFKDEDYRHMSNNAKLLYGLLADKLAHEIEQAREYENEYAHEYARKDGFGIRDATKDEDGHIYINFPAEELAALLNISKATVTKLFKELEAANLIMREKHGLGKPDRIYVGIAKDEKAPWPWRTRPNESPYDYE